MFKDPVFLKYAEFLKYAVIVASSLGVALSLLRNAAFAIRHPAEYLRSTWTIRRGLTAQTPLSDVRLLGVSMIVGAAFFLLAAYAFLPLMIQAWKVK